MVKGDWSLRISKLTVETNQTDGALWEFESGDPFVLIKMDLLVVVIENCLCLN